MSESSVALCVYPGRFGRRPLLERIVAWLKERGLKLAVCAPADVDIGAVDWAEDLAEAGVVSADDVETALEATKHLDIRACFTYDEFGVEFAAALAERLQVPGTPVDVIRAIQDKHSFRKACNTRGALSAQSWQILCSADLEKVQGDFPKVIKPTRGCGSYWCRKVVDRKDLHESYASLGPALQAATFPSRIKVDGFVVEDYIGGDEFDVDGVVVNGRFEFACVSDNFPAVEPDFLETGGHYPTALPESRKQRILDVAAQVVAGWPKINSVVHFEGKIVGEEVFALEMNMRMAGAEAPASVQACTGVDLALLVPMAALADTASIKSYLASVAETPRKCVRSINVQLDPDCQVVTACGPRVGTAGPESLDSFVGAQFYAQVGSSCVGTGSQRTVAWVAAAGASHEEADVALEECLALCEFTGSADLTQA